MSRKNTIRVVRRSATRLTTAEQYGYQRAWMKRMRGRIDASIARLEVERATHLRLAADLGAAIASMRKLKSLKLP